MGTRFGRTVMGLAGVAVLGMTACGGSSGSSGGAAGSGEASKDAATIYTDAVATLKSATSVHLKANLTGSKPLVIDVVYTTTPAADTGTVTAGGFTLSIASTGGKLYIKSKEYWAAQAPDAATAAVLGDNWVLSSSTDPASGFTPATFADNLAGNAALVKKGDTSTINGQAVIALNSSDGVMYVATTGTPDIVQIKKIATPTSDAAGTLDFSDYNAAVTVTAPPSPLDPSNLPAAPAPT